MLPRHTARYESTMKIVESLRDSTILHPYNSTLDSRFKRRRYQTADDSVDISAHFFFSVLCPPSFSVEDI